MAYQLSPGMGKALRLNKRRDGGLGARARTLSEGLYPVSGSLLAAPHAVLIRSSELSFQRHAISPLFLVRRLWRCYTHSESTKVMGGE